MFDTDQQVLVGFIKTLHRLAHLLFYDAAHEEHARLEVVEFQIKLLYGVLCHGEMLLRLDYLTIGVFHTIVTVIFHFGVIRRLHQIPQLSSYKRF